MSFDVQFVSEYNEERFFSTCRARRTVVVQHREQKQNNGAYLCHRFLSSQWHGQAARQSKANIIYWTIKFLFSADGAGVVWFQLFVSVSGFNNESVVVLRVYTIVLWRQLWLPRVVQVSHRGHFNLGLIITRAFYLQKLQLIKCQILDRHLNKFQRSVVVFLSKGQTENCLGVLIKSNANRAVQFRFFNTFSYSSLSIRAFTVPSWWICSMSDHGIQWEQHPWKGGHQTPHRLHPTSIEVTHD